MDPLSITAASIAFLGALSTSVEAVTKLWGAPDELRSLASELSELTELVKQIIALTSNRKFHEI
jgi:hypothetical protein